MDNKDKTIFEEEETVFDPDETVLEAGATVREGEMTLPDATLSDAASQAKPANPAENTTIEKGSLLLETYSVESDAMEGGMGSVWRVHHRGWDTDLAMKRPQPEFFTTEESKANFTHECEAWIGLGLHPNIVSCHYVREIGGVPSIFSEWMDGGSLEDAIKRGTLYEGTEEEQKERLLDIVIQFARGLHHHPAVRIPREIPVG